MEELPQTWNLMAELWAEKKGMKTWAIKKWPPSPVLTAAPGNTELVVTAQPGCLQSELQQLLADPQLNDLILYFLTYIEW